MGPAITEALCVSCIMGFALILCLRIELEGSMKESNLLVFGVCNEMGFKF